MRKAKITMALAALAIPALLPAAAVAQAQEAPADGRYSVDTTPAGKLIDDPAAAAVLEKLIPTIWGNEMFQSAGRELTLRAIQQYEAILTEAKLAEIQVELDKIPAKK